MKLRLLTILSIMFLAGLSSNLGAQCDYPANTAITISSSGGSTNASYTTRYVLVDASGNIVEISDDVTFAGVAAGSYNVYAINYKNITPPPAGDFVVGEPWADIATWSAGPNATACADINGPLAIVVGDLNDVAVSDIEICDGETAAQTVTVTSADPGVTYTIQPIGGGTAIATATFSGATAADFDITFPGGSLPATTTSYEVIASLSGCTDITLTDQVTVTVTPAVAITTQPSDATVCDGETTTFTVAATNASGYQWQSSTDGGTTYTNITGATSASYTTAGTEADGTQFQVVVSGNGTCGDETSSGVTLTVTSSPVITNPGPIAACDSYTLPTIAGTNLSGSQAYYDGPQSGSPSVLTGPITSTTTAYIYDANGSCSDEESFLVTITTTPSADAPGPVAECGSYELPALSAGNAYYTATGGSGGAGTEVAAGSIISTTTTLFVYASNGDCSSENSFTITITPAPTVNAGSDVSGACTDLATFDMNVLQATPASATNGTITSYASSGTGTFSGAVYTPSAADLASPTPLTITVTATGAGDCASETVTDTFTLEFTDCCAADAPTISKN